MYELMACPHFHWSDMPLVQVWMKIVNDEGHMSSKLMSYKPSESISLMVEALSNNKVAFLASRLSTMSSHKMVQEFFIRYVLYLVGPMDDFQSCYMDKVHLFSQELGCK